MHSRLPESYNVALKEAINALAVAALAKGERVTQQMIAARAGIENTRFTRILHGRILPTTVERRRLARILRRRVSTLFHKAVA